MEKENKRKIIIVLILMVVLVGIVAVSYAVWSSKYTQTGINKNVYDCFNISYSETTTQGINLENAFPQLDEDGIQNAPYEVQISNTCDTPVQYNVLLHKSSSSTLDDKYLKVAVDGKSKLLSNAEKLSQPRQLELKSGESFTNSASYIIGSDILGSDMQKTVKVRNWIDENTPENGGQGKTFTFKVTIEAQAGAAKIALFGQKINVRVDQPDFTDTATKSEDVDSGVFIAQDNDGTSYYFRGSSSNNYVKFADYTWRILRINGDGSIRLILKEKDSNLSNTAFNSTYSGYKYVGYTYDNSTPCTKDNPCRSEYNNSATFTNKNHQIINSATNSTIKTTLEKWYHEHLAQKPIKDNKKADEYIAYSTYCNDTSYGSGTDGNSSSNLYYGPYKRIWTDHTPTLECPDPYKQGNTELRDYGGVYKLKIGLISADELSMINQYFNNGYLWHDYWWWTMSPYCAYSSYAYEFYGYYGSIGYYYGVNFTGAVLPVINLKADALNSGNGTVNNPYTVK